nr:DUF5977 domain-containing protein [Flavobacterium sp. ASV13]
MKKTLLILFLLQFTLLIAQNGKDNFFPPTPEANSLIKYVDVPVNYSTGVTNYSIPVHTIKLKNLTIPITLTYQSSGFKPSEVASNTGLGWELNAGGKITQNVVQKNDLDTHSPANPVWNLPNDRDFKLPKPASDLSWTISPYSRVQLDSIHGAGTDYTTFTNIAENNIDSQPDIFYYSTPNKSGKFFFGNNFEVKQIPFGKEKIIYNSSNYTFEITDTDGVRYIYNIVTENLNSTESVCLKFPKLNGMSNSNSYTFYLAQIITPNNEIVDFIYDTVKYNLINDKDYTRYYHWFFGGGEKITSYYSEITTKVLTKIKVNQDYEIEFLYNKYRKDIKGKVQAAAPKTLDNIKIKYKNEIETYQFDYGYFGIPESQYNPNSFEGAEIYQDNGYTLKLKSFQKTGENPYVFSYYNEEGVGRYVPCLDHWGYYSNNCNRYTMNTLFSDLGSTKEPNLEKTKTNVLKNVTLPTKGEVEFNYELNTCFDCSIPYTTYEWESYGAYANGDDKFTGEEITIIKDFIVPEKNITVPYLSFNLYSPGEATTSNYAIAELYDEQWHLMDFPFIGTTGNNYKPANQGLVTGKKYYLVLRCYDTFENQDKFVSLNFLYPVENMTEVQSLGGLRIRDIKTKDTGNVITHRSFDYREDGKSSGILYEKPFYFDEYGYFSEINDPDANTMGNGLITYAVQYSRIPSDLFGFNGYHIFYTKVTENNTDTQNVSNIIKVEKYFTFSDDIRFGESSQFSKISYNWKRGLLSQINEFNKTDMVRKTIMSYKFLDTPPGDKTSISDPGFPLMNATFPNEFHKRGLDVSIYRRNASFYNLYNYTSSKTISAWYYMDKKTTEENLDGKILKTEENYKYDNPTHAQLTSQTVKNSKGEVIETKYAYPDDLLGEPFMTALSAANRISTPIITEQYKGGTLLSKNKTVFAKDGSTGNLLLPKEIYSAKFPNDLPDISNIGKLEKKITYNLYDDKGNVMQYTPESGVPVSIIWGYNKTLPIAKIENVTYDQVVNYVSNLQVLSDADNDNCMSAGCKEQLLRNSLNSLRSTFSNAFVSTYTYNPLVGVTSITDPKGITSYYEYDAVGRLKFIKDQELNVLQKYCYNYKGQQTDCSDNSSTSVFIYKSAAKSGVFTRNNCAAAGTPQSVTYTVPAGRYSSDVSQAAADAQAQNDVNTNGQAYANNDNNAKCIFSSVAKSGVFTRNNCAAGGTPQSVTYSVPTGRYSSDVSQAAADAQAQNDVNANGQAYANNDSNVKCIFSSSAKSGVFTRNNCATGGTPQSVTYTVPAGRYSSDVSQAAADAQGQNDVNENGQAYANNDSNAKCIFSSVAKSGVFTRDNCATGGTPQSVTYTVPAGRYNSDVSQAAADAQAQNDVNANGQAFANDNNNAKCIFWNTTQSRLISRNNCAAGGTPSSVWYTVAAGVYNSNVSQAAADGQALQQIDNNGQAYANATATCTFYSIALSHDISKNDCALGGVGSSVVYSQAAGIEKSNVSQEDANSKGYIRWFTDGQAYINANGFCTFSSAALGGYFPKTNCGVGGDSPSIYYGQVAGAITSRKSQADADAQALAKFYADGEANANASQSCTYKNTVQSRLITRNNCAAGGTPESVWYTVAAGVHTSYISQADANVYAQLEIDTYGQAYANSNGVCMFYNKLIFPKYYKTDCPAGTTNPYVYYTVEAGKYHSTKSQLEADTMALTEANTYGPAYANEVGRCLNPGETEE